MTTVVDLEEAGARFQELLERVERGEEIVITRDGQPVARLVPFREGGEPRHSGLGAGGMMARPDFDRADEEAVAIIDENQRRRGD